MASKLFCVLLLALVALQVEGSVSKRALNIPILNLADPKTSLDSLTNFTNNAIAQLTQLGGKAVSDAQNAIKQVQVFAQNAINKTKTDVESLVTGLAKKLENTTLGHGIKAGKCFGQEVANATAAGSATVKSVVACTTDQVNSILNPAADLIKQGNNALTLAYRLYQNVTSCFPADYSQVNAFNIVPDLLCAVGKIGPLANEVTTSIQSLFKDITGLQSSIGNVRNSIVRCPRERVADLISKIGNIVSDFGKCTDAINPDPTTAAPVASTST